MNTRNVLIVGSRKRARELFEAVEKNKSTAENMGIKVRIIPDWELHYLQMTPGLSPVLVLF